MVKDMIIDGTPAFEQWFTNINRELTPARTGGRIKVSVESVEAGLVDFKTLAAETRRKMGASFAKGQSLGKSHAGGEKVGKKSPGRPKKTATAK